MASELEFSFDGSSGCFESSREIGGESPGLRSEEMESRGYARPHIVIKPIKRQRNTISKGHKNYELMLNLQRGIRYSNISCHYSKLGVCILKNGSMNIQEKVFAY